MSNDLLPKLVDIAIIASDFGFQPVRLMTYKRTGNSCYDLHNCKIYTTLNDAADAALEIRRNEQPKNYTTHFNVINQVSEAIVRASQPDQPSRWWATAKR